MFCCSATCIFIAQFKTGYHGSTKFIKNYSNGIIGSGGAIAMIYSSVLMSGDIRFAFNRAQFGGAFFSLYSTITASVVVEFAHNCARYNDENFASEHPILACNTNIVFYNNSANAHGGGLVIRRSKISISGVVNFTGNRAYKGGGLVSQESNIFRRK